jgi:hypothetical protein
VNKIKGPVAALIAALPVRYRSRAGAALATLGVVISILSVACADRPEVAVIMQILTALGVVAPDNPAEEETAVDK